jgi:cyd operon protein YbgT
MWYFAWLLGLPLAALFAVVNAMWLEMREDQVLARRARDNFDPPSKFPGGRARSRIMAPSFPFKRRADPARPINLLETNEKPSCKSPWLHDPHRRHGRRWTAPTS